MSTARWRILAALLACTGAPAVQPTTAPAQEPAVQSSRERARQALPPAVFDALAALAADAAGDGVPEDPLFDKALEGVAKRVPPDRIMPAVTAYAGRLRSARSVFGAGATTGLLVAGADALQRGVPIEGLRQLADAPARSPMGLVVVADLIEAGVPHDHAQRLVRDALDRGTGDESLLTIPEAVRRLVRSGRSPAEAAAAVRRAVREGRDIRRPPPAIRPGQVDRIRAPAPPGSEPVTRQRRRGG
jgi:hypothetical protein